MNFGPETETSHKPKVGLKFKKLGVIIALLVLLAGLAGLLFIIKSNKSPLPPNIKNQITYKVVYPSDQASLGSGGYQYQADQKTLAFTVNQNNTNVVFAEQPAPSNIGSGDQIFFSALGIHPYAQFQSKLGPVALTKFWQSTTLKPLGQTAVLVANGTMVVAHADKDLTNEQWKDLINSLNITK